MELVNGEPPNASTHPMKVLFLIPKAPAPRLEGNNYSKDFKDFVANCLIKDPDRRPTAKELLRHKFIRNAGKTEALQELILRRQEWDGAKGTDKNLRYYAETMKSLDQSNEDDAWVFDTIKAPTMTSSTRTQKRRKLTASRAADIQEQATEMMQNLSLTAHTPTRGPSQQELSSSSTMRRAPELLQSPQPESPSVRNATKKRHSSGHMLKQPLGVNMSFGNSPSTVRQFRRVSPSAENAPITSKLKHEADAENMPPPAAPQSNAPPAETKESVLGKRAYAKAIGISCQEILNTTADQGKRETMARLAECFSDLEQEDPEGIYHVVQLMIEKLQSDPKLASMLPTFSTSKPDSDPTTPQKPTKLVLAQNNPHLKSHKRRQSAQIQREDSGYGSSSPMNEKISSNMPGQCTVGMEHVHNLESVLYGRWLENLANKWPNMA